MTRLEDEGVVIHTSYIQFQFEMSQDNLIQNRKHDSELILAFHDDSDSLTLMPWVVVVVTTGVTDPTKLHPGSTDPHVSQDRLWVARFNGGAVGCYDPRSGSLVAEVHVPKEAGRQVEPGRGLGRWKWRARYLWDI